MSQEALLMDKKEQGDLFKAQVDTLASLLDKEGLFVRTYEPSLPFFSKLTSEHQARVNRDLGFYLEVCKEQIEEEGTLKDSPSFLWRALRHLNFVPRSDLFPHFRDDSVIEIYSAQNIQLFRNINFFKFCSYSLEELHSREWWDLYHRESEMTHTLYGIANMILDGKVEGHVLQPVPPHTLLELESAERFEMDIDMYLVSPLTQNKRVTAFVVAENVKILRSHQNLN